MFHTIAQIILSILVVAPLTSEGSPFNAPLYAAANKFEYQEEPQASSPEEIGALTSDQDRLIGGVVSPLSGAPCISQNDLIARGAQNVLLNRTFISPFMPCSFSEKESINAYFLHLHLKNIYRGWQFLTHEVLYVRYIHGSYEIQLTTPSGAVLDLLYKDGKSKLVSKPFAMCNFTHDTPSGKYDPRNASIIIENGGYIVSMPDGSSCSYSRPCQLPPKDLEHPVIQYLIEKEVLPNGKILRYFYNFCKLIRIESTDLKGQHIYASIGQEIVRHNVFDFKTNCGLTAQYQYEMKYKEGETKLNGTYRKYSSYGPYVLTSISSPFYAEERSQFCPNLLMEQFDGFSDKFKCTYGKFKKGKEEPHYRVQTLSLPVGPNDEWVSVFDINYDPPIAGKKGGSTTVQNCDGTKTIYVYSKNLLLTEIRYIAADSHLKKKKRYKWDNNQRLSSIELWDGENALICKKSYTSDKYGNPIKETVEGDLCGNGHQDSYTITREFSQDGRHLLLKESADDRPTLYFEYLPSTNLITAKLTKEGDRALKREFFDYDGSANLIRKIADDGASDQKMDLSNVTTRTITEYVLRQEQPFLHMPEWIIEKYWDGNNEKLQKRTHLVYDMHGNVCQEDIYDAMDEFAYSVYKEYSERGDLISETNPIGQKATYAYDKKGRCISETSFSQRMQKHLKYNANGDLCEKTEIGDDGTTHTTTYQCDPNSRLICKTDTFGNSVHYTYDGIINKVLKTEMPAILSAEGTSVPVCTHSDYNALGCEIAKVDANGNQTNTRHNAYGAPIEIMHPDGSKEYYRYSPGKQLKTYIDREGLKITYQYDLPGRVLAKEYFDTDDVKIGQETFTYQGSNVLTATDLEGNLTQYAYDGAGRKIREDVSGRIVVTTYDALGRVAILHEENGANTTFTHFTYDLLDRILDKQVRDHAGELHHRITYSYDTDGNTATTTRYINNEEVTECFSYDSFGRQIAYIDALGNVTKTVYREDLTNVLGQRVLRTTTISPKNTATIETHDPYDNVVKREVLSPENKTISCQEMFYDGVGSLLQQKDHIYSKGDYQNTQITQFTYTNGNYVGSMTRAYSTPEARTTHFEYSPSGNIVKRTNPNGISLIYNYDLLGYLKALKSSDDSLSLTYNFNRIGQLTEALDKITKVRVKRNLDPHGNIEHEDLSTGLQITKTFDQTGRMLSMSIPGHGEVRYTYGPLYLKAVTRFSPTGRELYKHEYLEYNLNGNLIKEKSIDSDTVTHQVDAKGRKIAICGRYFNQKCDYDAVNNLVSTVIDKMPRYFAYDFLDQLTQEAWTDFSQTHAYDSIHNRIEKDGQPSQVNELNELLNCQEATCEYDLNGNLIVKKSPKENVSYKYDPLNRLIEASNSQMKVEMVYDPLGRCLSKLLFRNIANGWEKAKCENYLYSDENDIGAFSDGKLMQLRVLGLTRQENSPETVSIELSGKIFMPKQDSQGNITRLIDVSTKDVHRYELTAFGEDVASSTEGFFNPWRYASKRFDPELKLINFGKRYYDPELARWLTTDPAGCVDSMNLYQYVFNNPYRYTDPDGQLVLSAAATMFLSKITIADVALFFNVAETLEDLPYADILSSLTLADVVVVLDALSSLDQSKIMDIVGTVALFFVDKIKEEVKDTQRGEALDNELITTNVEDDEVDGLKPHFQPVGPSIVESRGFAG